MARPKPNISWVGSTLGGRYQIERYIDQGGMSAVYEARDPNLKRTVAIKIIHNHLSLDPKFVQRFEQEASSVASLRHPNIVQVYDFNHDENTYYMVMEYIPGKTLKQVLNYFSDKNQRLPLAETIRIMTSICDAVDFAHQHGMIHRDLKPANVMLTPKGQVVLMDFGVVKMLGQRDMTATGATIGTAKYMSPEQARGGQADERSDIYALGVILYEMVAGQPPFDSDTTIAILMKHVTEPVPDIRKIQKEVPNELVEIIEKTLAKDPASRYQSARQIGTALRLLNRLEQAEGRTTDSQATVSSKQKQSADAVAVGQPQSTLLMTRPKSVTQTAKVAAPSNSKNLAYWVFGLGAVGCILLFVAAGILTYLFGPLLNGAQATGLQTTAAAPTSAGMVRVSAGNYSVGLPGPDREHAPQQTVELAEFWIDQHETTNAQFAGFLAATNQPPPLTWPDGKISTDQTDLPVMGITWEQAKSYCEWTNKRLPHEAEWEIAARGTAGRLYPWGDNQQAVQLPRSGTYPVGSKLTNQSPFGVFDMAGNVWEWVDEPYAPISEHQRILRGGTNDFLKDMAYRLAGDPTVPTMIASAGVRCAASQVNVVSNATVAEGVLFEDSFIDPGSGWPILSEGAYFYGYHPPDYYHVEIATANNFATITHPPNIDSATIEADVLIDHTDTEDGNFRYGLIVRWMSEDQFYAFTLAPRSQAWHILKNTPAGLEVLAEGEVTSLKGLAPHGVTPDRTDQLRVDANGTDFVFRINNQVVAKVSDSDYAIGETGFYVETFDETLVHAHYDKLTIRQTDTDPGETSGTLKYDDEFTNPASGWPAEDLEGAPYRYGYHPPDYYHVEPRAAHEHIAVSIDQTYGDVAVETRAFVDHTDTETGDFRYGLVLRREAEDRFYAFTISPRHNTWQVLKSSALGVETLAEGHVANLKGLGAGSDLLRVDALAADFAFQINGELVTSVSNVDYTAGEVGFYVENLDESLAHIHYESLTIDKANPDIVAAAPEPVQ